MPSTVSLNESQIKELRDLAQLNIDSRDGFQYAIDKLPSTAQNTVQFFKECAEMRSHAANELNKFITMSYTDADADADTEPACEGSYLASLHRSLMALRDLFSAETDQYAVLAEAERGEDAILSAYRDASRRVFGSEIDPVIREPFAQVQTIHDRVRAMRDSQK